MIFWWLHIEMNAIFWSLKLVWWGRKSSRRLRILGCLGLWWSILTCIKHIKQHTPLESKCVEPENTLPIRKGENIFQIFIFGFNMLVISFLGVFPCKHDQDSDTDGTPDSFGWFALKWRPQKWKGWVHLWCHSTWTIEIMYSIFADI